LQLDQVRWNGILISNDILQEAGEMRRDTHTANLGTQGDVLGAGGLWSWIWGMPRSEQSRYVNKR
jgi:hypothetical protein